MLEGAINVGANVDEVLDRMQQAFAEATGEQDEQAVELGLAAAEEVFGEAAPMIGLEELRRRREAFEAQTAARGDG